MKVTVSAFDPKLDAVSIDNISQVMVDLPVTFPAGGSAWLPSRMHEVASGCSTMAALRFSLDNWTRKPQPALNHRTASSYLHLLSSHPPDLTWAGLQLKKCSPSWLGVAEIQRCLLLSCSLLPLILASTLFLK